MTSYRFRTILVCLLGFFFAVATLEIDCFDVDNTFFDQYDSYVKLDSKATQRILTLDLIAIESPENAFPACVDISSPADPANEQQLFGNPPRLFLLKSSLLI